MKDTFECPNCEMESAYFDGQVNSCPDCDYEWENLLFMKNKIKTSVNQITSTYESLSKLKKPFFKLKQGKLYDAKVDFRGGIEEISIIPLAFRKDSNCQFVMLEARDYLKRNPRWLKEIVKMDFTTIWNDGTETDDPFGKPLAVLCATDNEGTLIDYDGAILFDFIETNEI